MSPPGALRLVKLRRTCAISDGSGFIRKLRRQMLWIKGLQRVGWNISVHVKFAAGLSYRQAPTRTTSFHIRSPIMLRDVKWVTAAFIASE